MSRLTLDERPEFLHQFGPAMEQLGIAAFRTGQEALHGVAWMGRRPCSAGRGDRRHLKRGPGAPGRRGGVQELGRCAPATTRQPQRLVPDREPTAPPLSGRNEEGYSEDPDSPRPSPPPTAPRPAGEHPTYWRGARPQALARAQQQTDRDTSSASVAPILNEYDLRAFRETGRGRRGGRGDAGGTPGQRPPQPRLPVPEPAAARWTEADLLVCSDAGARPTWSTPSTAPTPRGGDRRRAAGRGGHRRPGTDSSRIVARVRGALDQGLLTRADIDAAVRRQLSVRSGSASSTQGDPYAVTAETRPPASRRRSTGRWHWRRPSRRIVLLKNDGVLPLAPGARVAVVGLLADECQLDWYSGTLIHRSPRWRACTSGSAPNAGASRRAWTGSG